MRFIVILLILLTLLVSGCGKKEKTPPIKFELAKVNNENNVENKQVKQDKGSYEYDPYAEADELSRSQDSLAGDTLSDTVNLDSLIEEQVKADLQKIQGDNYEPEEQDETLDSAKIAEQAYQDSVIKARNNEIDQYQEQADFVNESIDNMWNDAENNISFLNGSKTASQVRAKALEMKTKAIELKDEAKIYDESDPRRQSLENHADFLNDVSARLSATKGSKSKMQILQNDIRSTLQQKSSEGDIIIGE